MASLFNSRRSEAALWMRLGERVLIVHSYAEFVEMKRTSVVGNTDAMLAEFGNVTDVQAKNESDARAQMEDGLKVSTPTPNTQRAN